MGKKIGVTIGRYQPFHKGHEAIVRKLSKEYDRVYVFVAGNKMSKGNPLPFAFRKKIINLSMKGASNVKFLMAVMVDDDGRMRGTGYLPDLIKRLKIKPDDRVDILVGNDRYQNYFSIIEKEKMQLNVPLNVSVKKMPNVSVDNDTSGRISGTEVRSLIIGGNKDEARKRMSSNLGSKFDEFYDKMRNYMGRYYRLHESSFYLTEAEGLASLKGISHIEDLSPFAFLKFLEKWHNTEIDGGLEISEKVDGSAQISFGVSKGKVYAKSKYGKPIFSSSGWPKTHVYDALRNAHYALESVRKGILQLYLVPNTKNPDGYDIKVSKKPSRGAIFPQYFTEVLWTRVPNSIEYGDNILMIYGIKVEGGHISSSGFEKKVIDKLIELTGKRTTAKGAKWRMEGKIILSKSQFEIATKVEYKKLRDILKDIKAQEVLLKQARTPEQKKARAKLLAKINKIQQALKKKFISSLRSSTPTYGPEDSFIEGIVIKDLESGAMIKVVDKDMFTAVNRYFWHYRELMGKGGFVGSEWQVGIGTQLKYDIAEQVFATPALKTPSAPTYIKNRVTKYTIPPELKSPNARFNWLLYEFIRKETAGGKKSGTMMSAEMANIVRLAIKKIEKLRSEWERDKLGTLTKAVEDSETGKVIKTVKMPQEVIKKTDKAFVLTLEEMNKLVNRIEKFTRMVKTQEAKKVICLKLFLGKSVNKIKV